MKTLTKLSADKKLTKLVAEKRLSKTSIIYGWINEMIAGKKLFRPVYSQGTNWNSSSLFDRTVEVDIILKLMGVEYLIGNDAPRGGKTGSFIKISTKLK